MDLIWLKVLRNSCTDPYLFFFCGFVTSVLTKLKSNKADLTKPKPTKLKVIFNPNLFREGILLAATVGLEKSRQEEV